MLAIKKIAKIEQHQLSLFLPEIDNEEVEVIILRKEKIAWEFWNENELNQIGKIGFHSDSFIGDDEDYSTW